MLTMAASKDVVGNLPKFKLRVRVESLAVVRQVMILLP